MTVLRWVDRRTEPWPNGMGVTHPLARRDDDSWRVSIAEVDADAPFSDLPDVHRQFVGNSFRGPRKGIRHRIERMHRPYHRPGKISRRW